MFSTISSRLIAGFSLLVLFLVLIAGLGLHSLSALREGTREILSHEVVIGDAADKILISLTRTRQKEKHVFITVGSNTADNPAKSRIEFDEALHELDTAVADFSKLELNEELGVKARKMPELVKGYRQAFEAVFAQIQSGEITTAAQADQALEPYKKNLYELGDDSKAIVKLSAENTQLAEQELEASSRRIERQLWTLSIVATIAAALSAWLIARSIIRPILSMRDDITRIDRDNDLSSGIRYQGKDEIGTMAVAINRLIGTLAGTMKALQQQSAELKTSAQQLATASDRVRRGSEQQADESTSMAAALEEISTSISHMGTSKNLNSPRV